MSLNILLTHNGSDALYAPASGGGGGGGGGGSGAFSTVTASTLIVADIYGLGGVNDPFTADGGIHVGGIGLDMADNPIQIGAGNPGIIWTANDGIMTGVSSINGSAYPPVTPPSTGMCFQLGTNGTVTLLGGTGGATQVFTPAFTTVVDDYYRASMCLVYNTLSGTPAGNAFLFFKTTGDVIQNIHIPLSSITAGVPFEVILFFKGTVTSTSIEAGLNDSAASQCTVAIVNVAAAPVGILEKLGAAQPLT